MSRKNAEAHEINADHTPDDVDDDRQSRGDKQRLGENSTRIAKMLIAMNNTDVVGLQVEDFIRKDILIARRTTTPVARKREERRLAGVLRVAGLEGIEKAIETLAQVQRQGARQFQLIERIRNKILNGDDAALESIVSKPTLAPWPTLVEEARQEEARGKPKGAKKRLFRALAMEHSEQVAKISKASNAIKIEEVP